MNDEMREGVRSDDVATPLFRGRAGCLEIPPGDWVE